MGTTTVNELNEVGLDLLKGGLKLFGEVCRGGSIAKGFGAEGDAVRSEYEQAKVDAEKWPHDPEAQTRWAYAEQRLTDYYSKRLLLIVEEVTEAFGELRSGRAMDETYHTIQGEVVHRGSGDFSHLWEGASGEASWSADHLPKPEGIPSELADIVIRVFDLAAEADIDLVSMIEEKLRYNATRPAMHGRKF